MSTAIGPTVVVSGIPAILGPFAPGAGAETHQLSFNMGAWAGNQLTVALEVAWDGITFFPRAEFSYAGPVSAWVRNVSGSIQPFVALRPERDEQGQLTGMGHPVATSATRIRYRVTAVDGAFASSGGTYTAT